MSCRSYAAAASAESAKVFNTVALDKYSLLCGYFPQPPIKVFGIEGRYAHAAYSAASKNKATDKVESELAKFQVRMFNSELALNLESQNYTVHQGMSYKYDRNHSYK